MTQIHTKIKAGIYHFVFCTHIPSYKSIHLAIDRKKTLTLYWPRVKLSCHIFNNLAKIFDGYLAERIGRDVIYCDLMNRTCNCSNTSKVNGRCVYGGKSHTQ